MATNQESSADSYRCPNCPGTLSLVGGAWRCSTCRYVPAHAAD